MKTIIFSALFGMVANSASAVDVNDVLDEIVGAGTFASVYEYGSAVSAQSGKLPAALLLPATFQFDANSISVGLSMANLALKELVNAHLPNSTFVQAAPVVINGAAWLGYSLLASQLALGPSNAADLLGKKAVYSSSDLIEQLAGNKIVAAMFFLAFGLGAAGFGIHSSLLFENAGALLGDWLYLGAGKEIVAAASLLPLITLRHFPKLKAGISQSGQAVTAMIGGFYLASFSALLAGVAAEKSLPKQT